MEDGLLKGFRGSQIRSRTQCCLFFREGPLQSHPRVGVVRAEVGKGKTPLSWLTISAEDQQADLSNGCCPGGWVLRNAITGGNGNTC